jgi:hypothetical protein
VEVTKDGRTVTATVDDAASLSDAELASRIQQILAQQGVDISVSVQDGRIQVLDPAGAGAGAPTGGTRETTWGKLKDGQPGGN